MAYQIVFSGIIDDDVTKPAYRAIVGRSVYEDFIVNVLQQRQKSYQHLADCIQAEMSRLTTEKKENLKDDPESFVLYLYINYALNLFDPLAVYPETGAPYAACARDIQSLYKSCDKERFIIELPILLQKELGEFCLTDDYDLARNKAPGDCINRRWPDLNYRKDIKYATQLVVHAAEVFEKEKNLRIKTKEHKLTTETKET